MRVSDYGSLADRLEAVGADIDDMAFDALREAVADGDDPYGSVLVSQDGTVLAERRNRVVTTNDISAHPELALAVWAAANLTLDQRRSATMYTSGEHCSMCASAHVRAGIGRLVYVLSAPMTEELAPSSIPLRIRAADVIAASDLEVVIEGPCLELAAEAAALFHPGC